MLYDAEVECERHRAARIFNISTNAGEWTLEHVGRYLDHGIWVDGWPNPDDLRKALDEEAHRCSCAIWRKSEGNEDEGAPYTPTNHPSSYTKLTTPVEDYTPPPNKVDENDPPTTKSINGTHPASPPTKKASAPHPAPLNNSTPRDPSAPSDTFKPPPLHQSNRHHNKHHKQPPPPPPLPTSKVLTEEVSSPISDSLYSC